MTDAQGWGVPYQPPPEPAPEAEPPEAKTRRRAARGGRTGGRGARRTVRLLGAALLLGVTAGAAVGYRVQADRPATPLDSLSQVDLVHPAKPLPKGKEPDPLPVSQDHATRTNGDLRKLVVPRPAGARDAEKSVALVQGGPQYVKVSTIAAWYEDESKMFVDLTASGIRRIALDEWSTGTHRDTEVALYQFRPGDETGAIEHADGQQSYMSDPEHGAGNDGFAIRGSGNARGYIFPVERKAGYMPVYSARALGYKGDIFFDINIYDTTPIAQSDLRKLAEQQVGRL